MELKLEMSQLYLGDRLGSSLIFFLKISYLLSIIFKASYLCYLGPREDSRNCSHVGQGGKGVTSLHPTPSSPGVGISDPQAPKAEVPFWGSRGHLTEMGRRLHCLE